MDGKQKKDYRERKKMREGRIRVGGRLEDQ